MSKQLVQSKLSEGEVVVKLRLAARTELELRDTIAARDKRIAELKTSTSTCRSRSVELCLSSRRESGARNAGTAQEEVISQGLLHA